jgi:uncharacterized membrane-anchored protein YhcB (DUF1043 family)
MIILTVICTAFWFSIGFFVGYFIGRIEKTDNRKRNNAQVEIFSQKKSEDHFERVISGGSIK